jgi:hypothetical protein
VLILLEFVDLHLRTPPAFACTSYASFRAAEPVAPEYYLENIGNEKHSKLALMEESLRVASDVDPETVEGVKCLFRLELGLGDKPASLLQDYYSHGCYADLTARLKKSSASYAAYEPKSGFFFVLEEPRCVCLTITYRVPGGSSEENSFELHVSGACVGALVAVHLMKHGQVDFTGETELHRGQ